MPPDLFIWYSSQRLLLLSYRPGALLVGPVTFLWFFVFERVDTEIFPNAGIPVHHPVAMGTDLSCILATP